MADVAGILGLMRHAANVLDAATLDATGKLADEIASTSATPLRRHQVIAAERQLTAASALASTVLRMVADFMTDSEQPEASP